MADTGLTNPGTLANDATVGTGAWDATNDATSSNNLYANGDVNVALTTIDSYSETNQDSLVSTYTANKEYYGQSFNAGGSNIILNEAQFYLKKVGSPTGNLVAYIYAHTGTFGSTGKPTGSALATSDNFDISTLTTSLALTTFNFSGANEIQLTAGTNYFVVVRSTGDSSNYLQIGVDASSQTHSGNPAQSNDGSSWTEKSEDTCFYVKGRTTKTTNYLKATNFGFSIPADATINGIKVDIEQKAPYYAIESAIKIVKADGTIGSTNKSTGARLSSTDTYISYGGASDLWGETWSYTNINDADFGVVASFIGTRDNVYIDHIRMTVYYTTLSGGAFFQMF